MTGYLVLVAASPLTVWWKVRVWGRRFRAKVAATIKGDRLRWKC
jgi:hypothetical protein